MGFVCPLEPLFTFDYRAPVSDELIENELVHVFGGTYDGPITPRPSRGIFQSRRRDLMVKQTGDALDKVWRAAGLPNERRFVPSAANLEYNIDYDR